MDFIRILRELWRCRLWLALGLVVCYVIGLTVGYQVSLSPFKLEPRKVSYGTASTKMVVDTTPTSLTDSGVDYDPLIRLAGVYAQLFSTETVQRYITDFSGIPSQRIVTEVPSSGRLITDQTGPQTNADKTQRSAQIAGEALSYRLDVEIQADLPIIAIAAQAPDETQALRLADGAAAGLKRYLDVLQQSKPTGRPVSVRRLGAAQSGNVKGSTGAAITVVVGGTGFLVWCLAVLAISTIARRWREIDADEEPRWPPDDARDVASTEREDVMEDREDEHDEDEDEDREPDRGLGRRTAVAAKALGERREAR